MGKLEKSIWRWAWVQPNEKFRKFNTPIKFQSPFQVIEPYKRILSHGGYLKSGGHNAIIVFSACHLPDRSRADYNYVMNNLFYYVIKTLEQLITEDYVLVYLHGASNRKNSPPFPWLKKWVLTSPGRLLQQFNISVFFLVFQMLSTFGSTFTQELEKLLYSASYVLAEISSLDDQTLHKVSLINNFRMHSILLIILKFAALNSGVN